MTRARGRPCRAPDGRSGVARGRPRRPPKPVPGHPAVPSPPGTCRRGRPGRTDNARASGNTCTREGATPGAATRLVVGTVWTRRGIVGLLGLPGDDAVLDVHLPRTRAGAVHPMGGADHLVVAPPVGVEHVPPPPPRRNTARPSSVPSHRVKNRPVRRSKSAIGPSSRGASSATVVNVPTGRRDGQGRMTHGRWTLRCGSEALQDLRLRMHRPGRAIPDAAA